MPPLDTFRHLFPFTRLNQLEDEIRYTFYSGTTAIAAEKKADEIILANGLPLIAEVQTWSMGGLVFEIALVVKLAPEEIAVLQTA